MKNPTPKRDLAFKMLTNAERRAGVTPFNGAAWEKRRKQRMAKSGFTGRPVFPWG